MKYLKEQEDYMVNEYETKCKTYGVSYVLEQELTLLELQELTLLGLYNVNISFYFNN